MDDKKRAKLFHKRYDLLFKFGASHGLIGTYPTQLIERFRNYYYGGIPASILLMLPRLCIGYCYDRALLVTLALEDLEYRVVDADIDSIRYNDAVMAEVEYYKSIGEEISLHYPNHSFVEVKYGNRWFVIDTTKGLVFDRKLYYLMERPVITKINSKEETMDFIDYKDLKGANLDKDKYASLFLLPMFEGYAETSFYDDELREEIQLYKELISFDKLQEEDKMKKKEKGIL